MSVRFVAAKPLQAGKLAAIIGAFFFTIAGFLRFLPSNLLGSQPPFMDWQLTVIVLVPLVSLALVLVVTAETLVAIYRTARADERPTDRFADRPVYTLVRIGEAAVAILGTAGLIFAISTLAAEEMPAPAGVALMLLVLGISLLILAASLARTLAEYYYHRRTDAA